jgi:hypothetical protein
MYFYDFEVFDALPHRGLVHEARGQDGIPGWGTRTRVWGGFRGVGEKRKVVALYYLFY